MRTGLGSGVLQRGLTIGLPLLLLGVFECYGHSQVSKKRIRAPIPSIAYA